MKICFFLLFQNCLNYHFWTILRVQNLIFFHWFCMFKFLQNLALLKSNYNFWRLFTFESLYFDVFFVKGIIDLFFRRTRREIVLRCYYYIFFYLTYHNNKCILMECIFSYFLKSFFLFCFLFNSCSFTQKRGVKKGKKHYYLCMIVVIM